MEPRAATDAPENTPLPESPLEDTRNIDEAATTTGQDDPVRVDRAPSGVDALTTPAPAKHESDKSSPDSPWAPGRISPHDADVDEDMGDEVALPAAYLQPPGSPTKSTTSSRDQCRSPTPRANRRPSASASFPTKEAHWVEHRPTYERSDDVNGPSTCAFPELEAAAAEWEFAIQQEEQEKQEMQQDPTPSSNRPSTGEECAETTSPRISFAFGEMLSDEMRKECDQHEVVREISQSPTDAIATAKVTMAGAETALTVFRMPHACVGLPERKTAQAAGYDLTCAVDSVAGLVLQPHSRVMVPTGICVAIPPGHYGSIRSRSGLAVEGIDVVAGVIDADYRGEIKVVLHNTTDSPKLFNRGDRIAQLLVEPIATPPVVEVMTIEELGVTARADGGFGSTDKYYGSSDEHKNDNLVPMGARQASRRGALYGEIEARAIAEAFSTDTSDGTPLLRNSGYHTHDRHYYAIHIERESEDADGCLEAEMLPLRDKKNPETLLGYLYTTTRTHPNGDSAIDEFCSQVDGGHITLLSQSVVAAMNKHKALHDSTNDAPELPDLTDSAPVSSAQREEGALEYDKATATDQINDAPPEAPPENPLRNSVTAPRAPPSRDDDDE